MRETRCCSTSGALLSPYSSDDANGQNILYKVNGNDVSEKFIAMHSLKKPVRNDFDQTEQTLVRPIISPPASPCAL